MARQYRARMPPTLPRTSPDLLAAARGDHPCDLAIDDLQIVNVHARRIDRGSIGIAGGRIAVVLAEGRVDARSRLAGGGRFAVPGLLDAHMHVESTMLPPSRFVELAVPHGTTGAIFDPHEIANVLGIAGIRWVMDDAADLPFRAFFGASSCVPSAPLETSGASLGAADLEPLFADQRVVALAEMMNAPGVVGGDPDVLAKVALGLRERIVDGHAPGLSGRRLQAYVAAGVSSDHECVTASEAREKLALGMQIHVREGSAARNLEALLPLVTPENAHRFCFCTDDRHPADLAREGHVDHVVRRAIALGLDPLLAIAMGSLYVARHYRLADLGALAPGCLADVVLVDDLRAFEPGEVVVGGEVVARDGVWTGPSRAPTPWPAAPIRLPEPLDAAALRVAAPESGRIRVIGMHPDQLVTDALERDARIVDGACIADPERDLLKLAVIERHRGSGRIGVGFAENFRLRGGALGSTVGHDAHNLIVLGDDDEDMLVAARALAAAGGGQCVVRRGEVAALLPLPIAGLMSDRPVAEVIAAQTDLLAAAASLGCPHHDPFMPLSFLPLPVIPHLKLTDLGLVDVDRFEVVEVAVSG